MDCWTAGLLDANSRHATLSMRVTGRGVGQNLKAIALVTAGTTNTFGSESHSSVRELPQVSPDRRDEPGEDFHNERR